MELTNRVATEPPIEADIPDSGRPAEETGTPPPQPCTWSLAKLLEGTSFLNNVMDDPTWTPSQVVGLLDMNVEETGDQLRENIRAKVDSIYHVVTEFEAYAERQAKRAQLIVARANTAKNRANGLKEYVRIEMERQGIEQLSGNERVIYRKKSNSPECKTVRDPTDADMLALGDKFIRCIPTTYSWQKNSLIRAMKAGEQFDFARLEYSYSVKLDDLDKPNVRERKRGKK